VVALEKFSGNYTLLNSFQPISSVGSATYPISSYSGDWGWPLVLPPSSQFTDISKYYTFFEYVSGYEGSVSGFSIDFENSGSTIPLSATNSELFDGGIFENMIIDKFTNTLRLN